MNEVKCVQDCAMYISLSLVAAEEQTLRLKQLHWLKV